MAQDQIVERELVDDGRRVGEVGVNFEADKVADYEQRGIFEIGAVIEQLLVGGFEVFMLALVFPAEEAALPDVGEALVFADLVDVFLEGVFGAFGVGVSGVRLVEDVA